MTDFTSLRSKSALAFDNAMPPVLQSYLPGSINSSYAVTLPNVDSSAHYMYGSGAGVACDPMYSSLLRSGVGWRQARGVEAALLRREIELRGEFHRLKAEDDERSRGYLLEQRHREEMEERQRLMEMARQIEQDRSKRVDEQQERLLQKEKELEEWKVERMREMENQRHRRQEEEDRRRELQHQRDLQRIKEEGDARAVSVQQSAESSKRVEEALQAAQRDMAARMQEALERASEAHRSELATREAEWTQRVEKAEMQRSTELANLQLKLSQDSDRAARGEEQLREARTQLTKLLSEMEQLRQQQRTATTSKDREYNEALSETHRTTIARLQQMYDDDKRELQRRHLEERERLSHEMERRLDETKDNHAALVRGKEAEIDSLERRLTTAHREMEETKAKLVLASRASATASNDAADLARFRDQVKTLERVNYELEDGRKRLERRLRESEERTEAQTHTLQGIKDECAQAVRQAQQEADDLRKANLAAQSELRAATAAHEEDTARLERQLQAAEESARHWTAKEGAARKAVDEQANAKRTWEEDKARWQQKLRAAEDELSACRRQQDSTQRELERQQAQSQQLQQQLDERTAQLHKVQSEADSKTELEYALRDAKAQTQRAEESMRFEKEALQKQLTSVSESKEHELQALREQLAEARRQGSTLRDEISQTKYARDEAAQKLTRELADKDMEMAQARRETESVRQTVEQWKRSYEELQQRCDRTSQQAQRSVEGYEEEKRQLQQRLNQAAEEKAAVERQVRQQETQLLTSSSKDSETQRALQERDALIQRLQEDVRQAEARLDQQRTVERQLRDSLALGSASPAQSTVLDNAAPAPPPQLSPGLLATSGGASSRTAVVPGLLSPPRPSYAASPSSSSPASTGRQPVPLPVPGLSPPAAHSSAPISSVSYAVPPPPPPPNAALPPSLSLPTPTSATSQLNTYGAAERVSSSTTSSSTSRYNSGAPGVPTLAIPPPGAGLTPDARPYSSFDEPDSAAPPRVDLASTMRPSAVPAPTGITVPIPVPGLPSAAASSFTTTLTTNNSARTSANIPPPPPRLSSPSTPTPTPGGLSSASGTPLSIPVPTQLGVSSFQVAKPPTSPSTVGAAMGSGVIPVPLPAPPSVPVSVPVPSGTASHTASPSRPAAAAPPTLFTPPPPAIPPPAPVAYHAYNAGPALAPQSSGAMPPPAAPMVPMPMPVPTPTAFPIPQFHSAQPNLQVAPIPIPGLTTATPVKEKKSKRDKQDKQDKKDKKDKHTRL